MISLLDENTYNTYGVSILTKTLISFNINDVNKYFNNNKIKLIDSNVNNLVFSEKFNQ